MSDGEWTILTLKEHLEKMLAAETELRRARREDDLLARDKAEEAMNKRLDAMNEIREQLREQAGTFLPREVFDQMTKEMDAWRRQVDNFMAGDQGRSQGISATGRVLVTVISTGIALIVLTIAVANYLTAH